MNGQPTLQFDVAYPERLSRGLIFIKWLMLIPHIVVIYFLQLAVQLTTLIAFFAILFTGKYPRGLWDFGMMYQRWLARVMAYAMLQRDEYPPFGDEDYPVLYHLEYPERLSRGLIFIKWLLVIPHLIVLMFVFIGVSFVNFIAWLAILFTGRFPRGMFDFVTGAMRWNHRVNVYMNLLTDAYPPFSMDQGPDQTALQGAGQYGQIPYRS
jgi:Domain of unknown function (DUF4389)